MTVIKRTLPILLLFSLAYGLWYYWQNKPVQAVELRVLQLDPSEVDRIVFQPKGKKSFTALREINGWQLNDGDRHLVSSSRLPDSLLHTLLFAESEDLIHPDSVGQEVATLDLFAKNQEVYELSLFCGPQRNCRQVFLQIRPRPEVFFMSGLKLSEIPLQFDQYRDFTLLDLNPLGRLDSLVWQSDSSRAQTWTYASTDYDLSRMSSSRIEGQDFADHFDEITHQDQYLGSYKFYGARDQVELKVFIDSQWIKPLVVWCTQLDGAYFSLDSLSEIGLPDYSESSSLGIE
ncbi:MAG: hypothetical protein AAFY36_07330 [Bacteroidota bacterium]